MDDWIGYEWLAREYGIQSVQPFATRSQIGKARASITQDGLTTETYPEALRPESSFAEHLTFAL